jgi:hypothetical protein
MGVGATGLCAHPVKAGSNAMVTNNVAIKVTFFILLNH